MNHKPPSHVDGRVMSKHPQVSQTEVRTKLLFLADNAKAREIISMQDNLQKLTTLLSPQQNGSLQALFAMLLPHPHRTQQTQAGVMISEDIRCACLQEVQHQSSL